MHTCAYTVRKNGNTLSKSTTLLLKSSLEYLRGIYWCQMYTYLVRIPRCRNPSRTLNCHTSQPNNVARVNSLLCADMVKQKHCVCVWWVPFPLHQMCVLIIILSQSGAESSRRDQVLGAHACRKPLRRLGASVQACCRYKSWSQYWQWPSSGSELIVEALIWGLSFGTLLLTRTPIATSITALPGVKLKLLPIRHYCLIIQLYEREPSEGNYRSDRPTWYSSLCNVKSCNCLLKDYVVMWVFVTCENRSLRSVLDCGSIGWVGLHSGLLRRTAHSPFHNEWDLQKNAAFSVKAPGEDLFISETVIVNPSLII